MNGTLDPTRFVVLGEGLAAGLGHFSLTEDVQAWSFPALAAEKLGVPFAQPLIEPPGVGQAGFQCLPVIVPDLLQTTVLRDFPRAEADLGNLSVPGLRVADALRLRPRSPLVWSDDPKQTLVNLILGLPGLTRAGGELPTQLEYARARRPTLALVALGYQEVLEPLVEGHQPTPSRARPEARPGEGEPTDLARFEADYAALLDGLAGGGTTLVAATIPNPLDTAYFSDLETAARICRTEAGFLERQFGLAADDLLGLPALVEVGYQLTARQVTGELPAGGVLSAATAATVSRGVAALNRTIARLAEARGAALFDLHGVMARLARDGFELDDRLLTADFLGGLYLLNGVYPGRTGHAMIANELLARLSELAGRTLPSVDVAAVAAGDANTLARLASGPRYTDEFLRPRTADELPAPPPADPSLLNVPPPFDPTKLNLFPVQTAYPYPPFDFGGAKAAAGCVPLVGVPAGGLSEPRLARPLELPEGLEQTLPLNPEGSYFGDALRAVDFPGEKPFLPGLPTFGSGGNPLFGGLAMTDSHLSGRIHIRFSEPDENGVARFEVTHPGGLAGEDGMLAAPWFFRLPSQLNRVEDVPGLVSSGELELGTGIVRNLRYSVRFRNTPTQTLAGVNPGLPPIPILFPGPPNAGSTWARFEQRSDGKLDFTFAGNLFLPLGEALGGELVRFPLPFATPDLRCASIVSRGTSLHPHLHLTTKEDLGEDLGEMAPEIPVNTVREYTLFGHNTSFGDIFGLNIEELGGEGTGRSHLSGRIKVQFGPRSGNTVPIALSFLPPGGFLSDIPRPLPYVPPGTSRGLIGCNEQLVFPTGVVYHQTLLSSALDPNNLAIGAVNLKTGWVTGELLTRAFVVQQLFVNLISVEPCTPADSFNYQGPARFERGPDGETVLSFNGEVYLPYPKGFRFPSPAPDGRPPYTVFRASRLDPFLRFQAMDRRRPASGVLSGGRRLTSSIGQEFSYRFSIPRDPSEADQASFEYTNHTQGGTFRLERLTWLSAIDSPSAAGEEPDTITFGGFGSWSGNGSEAAGPHQVSVHVSTARDLPYLAILVDGGTTSNVNTKPTDIRTTIPLAGEEPP
jgi:hypothetical protein